MNPKQNELPRDFLPRLKADINRTLAARKKACALREQKIEQDLEQVKVYLNILESQKGNIRLGSKVSRKLEGLFSWKPKINSKNISPRKQQDQLEEHIIEIQKVLVGLISKRFEH